MKVIVCLAVILFFICDAFGQTDSVLNSISRFPDKLFSKINSNTDRLTRALSRQSENYLKRLQRTENRLKKKLMREDSVAAKKLFLNDSAGRYASYLMSIKSDSISAFKPMSDGRYLPYEDSLKLSLDFLKMNPQLLSSSSNISGNLQNSMNKLNLLQSRLNSADQIKEYVASRKDHPNYFQSKK